MLLKVLKEEVVSSILEHATQQRHNHKITLITLYLIQKKNEMVLYHRKKIMP